MTDTPGAQPPPPPPMPETPYVGLVPYGEDDADFFFGRDEEIRIVGDNLRASRLTILYGASGVGKTSMLQAGVVHSLHKQVLETATARSGRAAFAICSFRDWRDDPLPPLMNAIQDAACEAVGRRAEPGARWRPGRPVVATLRAWTRSVRTLFVVLDQFEDYFLYHPGEGGDGTFAAELPAMVNEPNLRVNVLLSIREDSWAKLDRFEGRIPHLFANYVRVEHLKRGAAREAIERPVDVWNSRLPAGEERYVLDPALVPVVIDAVSSGGLALTQAGAAVDPKAERREAVEAPFLQLVMDRLWRATADAGARDLTLARLEQLGGPRQIVENHLHGALRTLTSEEQGVAADLFRFLVTRSKTKIAHQASDLAEWTGHSEPEVSAVLEKLCRGESGRVLRRVSSGAENEPMRFELFHDVLAEPILEWRRVYEGERARRAALRRFVRIGGALLALVVVFAALGIWALVQRNEARRATKAATSVALASTARAHLDDDLHASLVLGLEAYRASPTPEARSAMVDALQEARVSGADAILRGDRRGVRAIAFSPDERTFASADFGGVLRLWDVQARTPLGAPFEAHTGDIWSIAFSPDGRTLASAGFDGVVRLWNVSDRQPRGEPLNPGVGAIRSVAFSPDGRVLALAGSDRTVQLFGVSDLRPMGEPLRGHSGNVVSVAFSPNGRMLASASFDRTVRVWDVATRRSRPLRGHEAAVLSVAFSPDGRTVASSDHQGVVRLWAVQTGRPLGGPPSDDAEQVWSVAFSPDGRTLAYSAFDNTVPFDNAVRLWDTRSRRRPERLSGHTQGVIAVAFSPDGRTFASSAYDGTARLWSVPIRAFGEPLGRHGGAVKGVDFSNGEMTLASAGFDGAVRLWDVSAHGPLGHLGESGTDSLEGVDFSPGGESLATAGNSGLISVWDVDAKRLRGQLQGHDDAARSVAFSPAGDKLASAGADGTVRLWNAVDLTPIDPPLRGDAEQVTSVSFSLDGEMLASAGTDELRLWDPDVPRPAGKLPLTGPDTPLVAAFSPDGHTLASGSVGPQGGSVQLWDVRDRAPLGEPLRGHAETVDSVAFSVDGTVLASAGNDGMVRLWDVDGRRSLGRPLRAGPAGATSVAFSPDGLVLATGAADGAVRLWEGILWGDSSNLKELVCRLAVGNLTESEWEELAPGIAYRTTCPG